MEALKWVAQLPWGAILEHAKSFALPLAGVYVAHKFGSIQADIGKRQANTAAQSMEVARNKLRLDLFERRLAVFEAANKFINKVSRRRRVTADERADLMNETKAAQWLFDERTAKYITEHIFADAYELVLVWEDAELGATPEERRKLFERRRQLEAAFALHEQRLPILMGPYLRFTDRSG